MSAINRFLLENNLRIATNPCVSPDFCLDWAGLLGAVRAGRAKEYPKSRFATAVGEWTLLENTQGDCAWKLQGDAAAGAAAPNAGAGAGAKGMLEQGETLAGGVTVFPATFANLLR